ncbi:MAG: tyrosine-type recombinase/integrase [Candidatus Nanohalobium sp.]
MEKEDALSVVEDMEDTEDHPIKFEKYIEELDEGSKSYSTDTVVNYLRYLKDIDFDPLSSNPSPHIYSEEEEFTLSDFHKYAERKAKKKDFEDDNSKIRYKYFLYVSLRSYLEVLESESLKELTDSRHFKKPGSESPVQAPEVKDLKKLVEEEDDDSYIWAYRLLFYAGHRISEVIHMRVSWISIEESYVKIRVPPFAAKGSQRDTEPEFTFLPEFLEEKLKDFIKQRYGRDSFEELWDEIQKGEVEDLYLLDLDEGTRDFRYVKRTEEKFNRHLKKTADDAGIEWAEDFSSHRFRKGFVHRMKSQHGLSDAKELARHESPDTTQNHYLKKELEEKGSKVEDAWT